MGCNIIKDEYGRTVAIACGRNYKKCYFCDRPMTSLCDSEKEDGTTCDLPMCDEHKVNIGVDTDVCPKHYNQEGVYVALVNRDKRDEAQNYFVKIYPTLEFAVVPGHWPDFETVEQVDEWIEMQMKMREVAREIFEKENDNDNN